MKQAKVTTDFVTKLVKVRPSIFASIQETTVYWKLTRTCFGFSESKPYGKSYAKLEMKTLTK